MLSFIQRISKINTLEQMSRQVHLAGVAVKRLRTETKRAGSLSEKVALLRQQKAAEHTAFDLRMSQHIIEDGLAGGLHGNELANWVDAEFNRCRVA